jgi:uncharacterized LabA/DUF88 family protein
VSKVAVFIDAGYFWVQTVNVIHGCKKVRESVVVDYNMLRLEMLAQVKIQFPNTEFLRVYWYDGPGPHGAKADSHRAIEELNDFKLKLGTRNGAGEQKAVDGLIIADMIGLSQSKAITSALVVSGDADLAPGVMASQSLGIRVHLLSMGTTNATSRILWAEADFKAHWDDAIVKKFTQAATVTATSAPQLAVAAKAAQRTKTSVSVPDASGATDDALLDEIAAETHHRLTTVQAAQLSSSGNVPREIDGILLGIARRKLKRVLTDEERRLLRAEFKRRITPSTGTPSA